MYDSATTSRKVDEQNAKQGWDLVEYGLPEIEAAEAHLAALFDTERMALKRALNDKEKRFIQNERRLCRIDFRYWVSRYAWIIDRTKRPSRFTPNIAQNIILDLWAEDEALADVIWMQQLKARRLGVCLDPSTRVLTKDLRWITLEDVQVGQPLIGVEEVPRTGRGAGRKILATVVEEKREIKDFAFRIDLDTGQSIVATGLHRFLYQRPKALSLGWKQVRRMVVGGKIKKFCEPWGESTIEDGWIAGMLDGEGCLSVKSGGAEANIAQRLGPVYDRVVEYMKARGYNYREEFERREWRAVHRAAPKTKRPPAGKVCVGRMSEMFRLIGQTRPTRFIDRKWWAGKELPGKKVSNGWATIVAITPLGERRMIDLQTSTKTFIAEGLVSHNSTLSELAIEHRFQFIPFTRAVVASADPTKTMDMASIIGFSLSRQPWWLLPQGKPKIKGGLPVEYSDIHSRLTIQAGNQFTGVARGGSPNCLHLSELAEWQDAAELIDAALLPAIQDFPGTFGIMEGTGQGDTAGKTWWQGTWEQNKRDYPRGRARMRPTFLPYFVGTDIFPTAADMIRHPIPANWIPSDRSIAHAERARDYVLSTEMLRKYVAKGRSDWTLPREQLWWRERMYETAKEKRELHIFLTEYASDDFEAFQTSMSPVVDPEILLSYQERTREPIATLTVVGPDIPPQLVVPRRYWDTSQKPITVETRELMPRFDMKYQLQPVKIDNVSDGNLILNIWEWPEQGEHYGLGADVAEGVGQDYTALEIIRESTPGRYPAQVAEFASSYITAFQAWPMAIAMACFYSTFRPSAGKRTQLRAAIECFANGKHIQHEMQKRGWYNFHPWKQYDNRKQTPDFKVNKLGVYTNHSFRSGMMDMLLTMLSEEAIDLPSRYIVHELTKLVNIGGKIEAAAGEHDDRIMALGFPLFSLHVGKAPSRQYARKRVEYIPNSDDYVKPNYAVWQPDHQSFDVPNPSLMRVQHAPGLRRQVELLRVVNRRMPQGFQ